MAKKITAITSLVIIGILILTTIIMAVVPVNHSIKCNKPDSIEVYYGSTSQRIPNPIKDEKELNKIIETINNSSKETALTALFNGTLTKNAELITETTNTLTTVPVNSNAFYVSYVYANRQTLMDGNKAYKDDDKKEYYFSQLCFEVIKDQTEAEVNVYVIPYYAANSETETYQPNSNGSLQYQKYYKLNANFQELYSYLLSLGLDK